MAKQQTVSYSFRNFSACQRSVVHGALGVWRFERLVFLCGIDDMIDVFIRYGFILIVIHYNACVYVSCV